MVQRPVGHVPKFAFALLVAGLALQLAWRGMQEPPVARANKLPAPPVAVALQLASLGEPVALAKVLMLYLQAFDYQSGSRIPYQNLDYPTLETWLERILELDPGGQYPLFAASRLYAEVPIEAKQRYMLDFVYRQFFVDPNRRWQWLAHAAAMAKHRLHDLPLARRYAAALQSNITDPKVPNWAKQMEIFILEDMNELETARLMIGGLLESGKITDLSEIRFLDQRLREIEARIRGGSSK
jgi:hypothetical protein